MIKRKNKNTFYILGGLIFLLVVIYKVGIDWATDKFGITINELLYTIISPLDGADTGFLGDAVIFVLPYIGIFLAFWTVYSICDWILSKRITAEIIVKTVKKQFSINIFKVIKYCFAVAAAVSVCATSVKADATFKIGEYITSYFSRTTIYEDYYVNPSSVNIIPPENRKNLIYIYLESMETTYADVESSGKQTEMNYIPRLTAMAGENISFSNTDTLGGFNCLSGTRWTMGSLFATTSGVPFSFPVEGNSMNERTSFASGITALGDILEQNGYVQNFLCGSDADFAGRKTYFTQHGGYDMLDLFYARETGYIPEDYLVWWGYEDLKLYDIAKAELTKLASDESQPFNFTMLTVDTHHVDGYVCENCQDVCEIQLGNVLLCADSQIYEFIERCKEQPFYENTVIVITGDHPRMDTTLVDDIDMEERVIYNCFINTDKNAENLNLKQRSFTAMDMFPTVLSALNFEIEGDKLGLGTDMFSDKQTLAEVLGIETLGNELKKYSKYYIDNFS